MSVFPYTLVMNNAINDLTNVDAGAPANQDVLKYNSVSGKWESTADMHTRMTEEG